MSKHSFVLIISLLILCKAHSQTEDFLKYKKLYPDKDAVTVRQVDNATISFDKLGKLQIISKTEEENILLSERLVELSENYIHHSGLIKLLSSEAWSLVPDNSKYKKMEVSEMEDFKDYDSDIFYDDDKIRKFLYPGLKQGAKTVLKYELQYLEPWVWTNFHFTGGNKPVDYMEYSVTFPENVKIVWNIVNGDSSRVKFSEVKKGKKITYKWVAEHLPQIMSGESAPNYRYYIPTLFVAISSYKTENEIVSLVDGHESLFKWYMSMVKRTGNNANPEMKILVDSLTNGITDEKLKVKEIYHWVQDNIRYVAFEDGYAGFTPRACQSVFTDKYGDCKGKANLLKELLYLAGIKSYLTWVGTIHLPYKRDVLPGKIVDNHMITTYISPDHTYYFLDPTSDFLTMEYPSIFTQGKEAMIAISDSIFEIHQIPIIPVDSTCIYTKMNLKLDKMTITGNGNITLSGYNHFEISPNFVNKEYDKSKDIFLSFFEKGNNKFKVDTLIFSKMDQRYLNGSIDFKYQIPDYVKSLQDKLFINLNLDRNKFFKIHSLDFRQCGMFLYFKEKHIFKFLFQIPDGWEVESIPSNSSYKDELFGYEISYKQIGNIIEYEKVLIENFKLIDLNQMQTWNAMVKQLEKAKNQSVVLRKKTK